MQLDTIPPLDRLVLHRQDNAPEVRDAYRILAPQSAYAPFQQLEWLDSWQAHVGDYRKLEPVTIIGHRQGKPVLLLALSIEKTRTISVFLWRAEEFCDYCGPLLDQSFAADFDHAMLDAILSAASRAMGGVDMARLQKLPSRGEDFHTLHHGQGVMPYHVSAHATRLSRDWDSYSRSKRSGKTLRKIKARLHALEHQGKVEISFARSRAEAISLVAASLDMKAAQLRKLGYWNPLSGHGAAAMLIACFGGRALETTWVASLKLDGRPLAIAYGFRNPKSWLVYQIAMDMGPEAHLSPGTHLLMFLLRHCCEAGVETFDLSLGDESYKTDWCELRTSMVADAIAFTLKGRVRLALFAMASRIRRAISTRPALYNAAKVVNRNLKGLSLYTR